MRSGSDPRGAEEPGAAGSRKPRFLAMNRWGMGMDALSFAGGVLCGIAARACWPWLRAAAGKLRFRLSEDEKYLLAAARTAQGRLIFGTDPASADTTVLLLKEFTQHRSMENRGQVEGLLSRELIEVDDTGVPGRYVLTPKGWNRANKLPPLALVVSRQGDWFNSISRRPKKAMHP